MPGSSPLARGLPRYSELDHHYEGIIPARAGFTPPVCVAFTSIQDHPRSRGVYVLARVHKMAGTGSSPLARGLPFPETLNTP